MERSPQFITPDRNLTLAQLGRPLRGQTSTSSSRPLKPLPRGIVIKRCKTASQLAGFKRLNTVLLPLPYPDRFYREILDDDLTRELTRIAVLYEDGDEDDDGARGKRKGDVVFSRYSEGREQGRRTSGRFGPDEGDENGVEAEAEGKVIGGIRCRLEDVDDGISHLTGGIADTIAVAAANALIPSSSSSGLSSSSMRSSSSLADNARRGRKERRRRKRIYIQTLAVLAPFRSEGIGSHLLDAIINSSLSSLSSSSSVSRRSGSSSSTITATLTSNAISPAPPLNQQLRGSSVTSSSSSDVLDGEIIPADKRSLDHGRHHQGRQAPQPQQQRQQSRQQRIAEEEEEGEENETGEEIIIEEIYAHVWQQNQAALEWYAHRGFLRTGPVVENYYRRLNPAGAFLLRLPL